MYLIANNFKNVKIVKRGVLISILKLQKHAKNQSEKHCSSTYIAIDKKIIQSISFLH